MDANESSVKVLGMLSDYDLALCVLAVDGGALWVGAAPRARLVSAVEDLLRKGVPLDLLRGCVVPERLIYRAGLRDVSAVKELWRP